MPPRNPLNTYRLVLWWLLGMMAVREFYEYATNKAVKRLGHHAWLGGMILTIEVGVCVYVCVCWFVSSAQLRSPSPPSTDPGLDLMESPHR